MWSTNDGGKSWQPLEGRPSRGWNAAALATPEMGLLADREGNAYACRAAIVAVAIAAAERPFDSRHRLVERTSRLAGRRRRPGECTVNREVSLGAARSRTAGRRACSERFPHRRRERRCRVDRRQSRRRHLAFFRRRQTLAQQLTGITTPINKLYFVNTTHGCAVGDLGVIVSTADGGETWTTARGNGRHLALLSVHARTSTVSPELLTKVAGEQGYRMPVSVAIRPADVSGLLSSADRIQAAVSQSGGAVAELAWQLPLEIPGLELDAGGRPIGNAGRKGNCRKRC